MTAGVETAETPTRPRRRRRLRAAVAIVTAIVLVAAATAGWFAYRYRSIERRRFAPDTLAAGERAAPQNFLLVGTDSRAFVDEAGEEASFGTQAEVGSAHADTILVLRTFPGSNRVAVMSFPRDLSVTVPGSTTEQRINTTLADGPDGLVRTIGERYGIPVNHFIEIDFRGFQAVVDAIGGVTVFFPTPVRDWDEVKQTNPTGLDIREPGCVELDGVQALAYVRSRHYQQLVDGEWKADPAGDLNRITRQQELLRKTLEQASRRGLRDPRRLNALLGVAVRNVKLDDRLGLRDLATLGRQFRTLGPEGLQTYSLPTVPGKSPDGADVLYLDEAAAQPALDVFRGKKSETAPAELLPAAVRVQVVDDGRREGTANAAAFRLAAAGFVVEPGVAGGTAMAKTVVRFGPGGAAKAQLVASRLVAPAQLEQVEALPVDVVLAIGADWQGVREDAAPAPAPPPEPAAAPAPASTDAPPSSTTAPAPAPTRSC